MQTFLGLMKSSSLQYKFVLAVLKFKTDITPTIYFGKLWASISQSVYYMRFVKILINDECV